MRLLPITAAAATTALLALTACGAGAPADPAQVPDRQMSAPVALDVERTLYFAGEKMEFELSLHGVVLGKARLAVGDPGNVDGRQVIIVRSQVESAGAAAMFKTVRDDVVSWISVETGLPVFMKADVKFGKKEAQIETRFNDGEPGSFAVDYHRAGRKPRRLIQHMPDHRAAFDGHSILGALRSWDGTEGEHAFFYVLSGRRLWHNTIRFTRREKVQTATGRVRAIRIDGVGKRLTSRLTEDKRKKPRNYSLWLSDDDERRPLRVTGKTEYGDVKVELVAYERPAPIVASD